jgi:hypothetical protein
VVAGDDAGVLAVYEEPVDREDDGIAIAAVACESDSLVLTELTLAVSPLLGTFNDAPHSAQKRLMLLFGESQTGQIREEDGELMNFSPLLSRT